MKSENVWKLVTRILAVPFAWCIAIGASSAAVPEKKAGSILPRSEGSFDRVNILHSLLGEELVPSDQIGRQNLSPPLAHPTLADETGSPPPPPSPP
jgi:hypothetical protein